MDALMRVQAHCVAQTEDDEQRFEVASPSFDEHTYMAPQSNRIYTANETIPSVSFELGFVLVS